MPGDLLRLEGATERPPRGGSGEGWGETPGGQVGSPGQNRDAGRRSEGRPGEPPALTPPLTHPRPARTTTPRGSLLAGYLSRGHPPTWPLHFRDTTLRVDLRGGTERRMEARGGGRTSGLPCGGLSGGGARAPLGHAPTRGLRPTS